MKKIGGRVGGDCPYKQVFCQEEYCSGCQIFKNWQKENGEKSLLLGGAPSKDAADLFFLLRKKLCSWYIQKRTGT